MGAGTATDADSDLIRGEDGALRCWWAAGTAELARYHDTEWGRGDRDETALFERLSLEAFQAGLSWRIVLERRQALRTAFADFVPHRVAALSQAHVEAMTQDARLIRNRAKIDAVVSNARLLGQLHERGILLRDVTDDAIARAPAAQRPPALRHRTDVPATSPASVLLARELRLLGWRFVGPTTAYAYLQAAGWVDDHLLGCVARGPDT